MGILRGVEEDIIEPLTETIIASGLKTIEITMNTSNAPTLIKQLIKTANGRLNVGAGTVLTIENLQKALDAGATFIVLPTFVDEIVKFCVKHSIPVFPGALTPQEIYNAWQEGATMVKVFPAKFFGPTYFKEIKGPFDKIELLACGGINAATIQSFFSHGASAAAFGASIFKKEWLIKNQLHNIEKSIKNLIEKYNV
jgi:2-dehydro-3-deoxyphosphogluconate aldolase/(4S)-4-hydroxy-2-oxoglutarate aldolase